MAAGARGPRRLWRLPRSAQRAAGPPAAASDAERRPSRFQAYRPGARSDGRSVSAGAEAAHRRADRARDGKNQGVKSGARPRHVRRWRIPARPPASAWNGRNWSTHWSATRSSGSRIWDIDGNEYIDLVNGYGPTAFGHSPDFVVEAIKEQLDKGFATGPQAELAGEVADAVHRDDRQRAHDVLQHRLGSGDGRHARRAHGHRPQQIVMFNGAYHGQFDEVLVRSVSRPGGPPRSAPIAAGIPPVRNREHGRARLRDAGVARMDPPERRATWLRSSSSRCRAAIPICSRSNFCARFARSRRTAGVAFIMDEIVTGFRTHPGGMQAVTGIRADLATYGKVIGGGLPIGILAGKAKFMDALDGGALELRRRVCPRSRRHLLRRHLRSPSPRAGGRARGAEASEGAGPGAAGRRSPSAPPIWPKR